MVLPKELVDERSFSSPRDFSKINAALSRWKNGFAGVQDQPRGLGSDPTVLMFAGIENGGMAVTEDRRSLLSFLLAALTLLSRVST